MPEPFDLLLLFVIALVPLEPVPRDDDNDDDEQDDRLDDFELLALEDCWCVCCWRTFARRFLNQTCKKVE